MVSLFLLFQAIPSICTVFFFELLKLTFISSVFFSIKSTILSFSYRIQFHKSTFLFSTKTTPGWTTETYLFYNVLDSLVCNTVANFYGVLFFRFFKCHHLHNQPSFRLCPVSSVQGGAVPQTATRRFRLNIFGYLFYEFRFGFQVFCIFNNSFICSEDLTILHDRFYQSQLGILFNAATELHHNLSICVGQSCGDRSAADAPDRSRLAILYTRGFIFMSRAANIYDCFLLIPGKSPGIVISTSFPVVSIFNALLKMFRLV